MSVTVKSGEVWPKWFVSIGSHDLLIFAISTNVGVLMGSMGWALVSLFLVFVGIVSSAGVGSGRDSSAFSIVGSGCV